MNKLQNKHIILKYESKYWKKERKERKMVVFSKTIGELGQRLFFVLSIWLKICECYVDKIKINLTVQYQNRKKYGRKTRLEGVVPLLLVSWVKEETVSEPGRGYRHDLGEYALTLSSAESCLLFSVKKKSCICFILMELL